MMQKKEAGKEQKEGSDRLERAIAHQGLSSRREAKAFIREGKVSVNGKVVYEPGHPVFLAKDKIKIDESALSQKESVLVYKRRGVETNRTTPNARDLHSEFPKLNHLHPIGRLDKDSEGLIIMSNDGTLARALTKENSEIGKEYLVTVREAVSLESLNRMRDGIVLDKVMTKPALIERVSKNSFSITLFEGRKHQIRRMCDACRLTIEQLIRVKIGHLKIGNMIPGSAKRLEDKDVTPFKK